MTDINYIFTNRSSFIRVPSIIQQTSTMINHLLRIMQLEMSDEIDSAIKVDDKSKYYDIRSFLDSKCNIPNEILPKKVNRINCFTHLYHIFIKVYIDATFFRINTSE